MNDLESSQNQTISKILIFPVEFAATRVEDWLRYQTEETNCAASLVLWPESGSTHRQTAKKYTIQKTQMPQNLRVTHKLKMSKIFKVKVKMLKSNVTYCCDVSSNSLAVISVVLRNSTTHLETDTRIVGEDEDDNMDIKSVGKMQMIGI